MQFVRWARLELRHQVPIEVSGIRGFCVYQESTTSDICADDDGAGDDILKHPGSKSATNMSKVDGEPSEQRNRLRVLTGSLACPGRCRSDAERSHAPRVVRDDVI